MADRYIADRFLPDKAIDLTDEAGFAPAAGRMETPPDFKELENEIATQVVNEKKVVVESQQFEEAGRLRDCERTVGAEGSQRTRDERFRH